MQIVIEAAYAGTRIILKVTDLFYTLKKGIEHFGNLCKVYKEKNV